MGDDMSEPIKLDASEVEFWKACLISAIQWSCNPSEEADNAVMALRERTLTQTNGIREWRECSICGKKLDASSLLPKENFLCCGNTMLMRP